MAQRAPVLLRLVWWVAVVVSAAIPFVPIAADAHPLHSEAIERPCEIHQPDDKASPINGRCSFFIAAGYLVFELDSRQAGKVAGFQIVSGAINLTQATGTLFRTGEGALADGPVVLAEHSPQVVHMKPGQLAAWDNGYTLQVSGSPAESDGSVLPVAQANTETLAKVFANYVELGFAHILPHGFDHILFVIGLFLLSPKLKPLLWQVSAFTLAHTLTLALGASGLVRLPPEFVEPLIALSIVWIAVENLMTNRLQRWRLGVIFCFGLLHGLGFAGVLLEIGLSGTHFYSALLAFNLGVELGQLSVIVLCFLAVGSMMKRPVYQRLVVVPTSCVIALTGAYWVVERTGFV
ncbi:MAG: HupE/UreJ family protein [Chromatiaceae bacterium]|jgi:hypothetical protein